MITKKTTLPFIKSHFKDPVVLIPKAGSQKQMNLNLQNLPDFIQVSKRIHFERPGRPKGALAS
jgi:hypothetical protein